MKTNITNKDLIWALEHTAKERSPKTLDTYAKIGEQKYQKIYDAILSTISSTKSISQTKFELYEQAGIPGQTGNRNTRSVDRAAMKNFIAQKIIENPNPNSKEFRLAVSIKKYIDTYARSNQKCKRNISTSNATSKVSSTKQLKKTKRNSLIGLNKINWREKLVNESKGSKYGTEILIMTLCGCRPSEMVNGVQVIRNANHLEIYIMGAKYSVNNQSGQPWRKIVVDITNPIFSKMVANLQSGFYSIEKVNGIEDAISHFGLKVVNRKTNKISAYSLRHAFASDLKGSGLSKADVSAALGHQSMITQSMYGGRSKSPFIIVKSVKAALPVRPKVKNSNLIVLKSKIKKKI